MEVGLLLIAVIILGGAAIYFWNATRKLEEQLIASESERRSQNEKLLAATQLRDGLLQALPNGLLVLDSQDSIIYANTAAEKLLEQPLVGKTLIEATRQLELDTLTQHNGSPEPIDKGIELGQRFIRAYAMSFQTNKGTNTILTLIDETELRRLGRSRRQMVADISHELRTPIATISLLAETLLNELEEKSGKTKPFRKMVKDIQRETATLTQLVQEMRDLSLIESGEMPAKLTPTSLAKIINRSLEPLTPLAERKEHHVKIDLPEDFTVLADSDQIERVVKNILHNAIKFTPNGGTIAISAASNGDEVTVSISDTGKGIAAENLVRIFERFFQESPSRTDGTGLGLAIARHIVMAHSGSIWAESTLGRGTTFYFTLPLAEALQPA